MSESPELDGVDLAGQTLDRYALRERIGAGGMGAVYEAEHTHLRKRVAVKLLRSDLAEDPAFRRRFLREARAASAVDHPHVVAISDFGETDDGHVFLVMERLTGRDLRHLLEEERSLPWPRTRNILLQVTAALRAAHEREIVHRDIKPSNVFLVERPGEQAEDVVKVLDFGIAKLMGHGDESSAELTAPKQVVGTVGYISPEMAMGVKDEPRSDVYAVGVMMFRMLTGVLPYREGNALAILAQHIHAPIPSARDGDPSIPEVAEAIIAKAMAKAPDDRFASMAELHAALERAGGDAVEPTEALPRMGIGEPSSGVEGARTDVVELGGASESHAPSDADHPGTRRWGIAVLAVVAVLGIIVAVAMPSEGPPKRAAVVSPQPPAPTKSPRTEPMASEPPAATLPVIGPGTSGGTQEPVHNGDTSGGRSTTTTTAGETESAPPAPSDPPVSPTPPKNGPRKPRSDRQVVTSLVAKIERRCGGHLAGKVRVEGMISAAGRVQSMLVTPPDGLGDCARLVKAAKFDPDPGARAMPRFSVEP